MRICKSNESGLIFGQGGPSMIGDFSFAPMLTSTEKPTGAAIPGPSIAGPAPAAPTITSSTPSTMNPTFSGQPSQSDPAQGLPNGFCGPTAVGVSTGIGGLIGGVFGSIVGAVLGDVAKDNMCPAGDKTSEVSSDGSYGGLDFGGSVNSAGEGLGDSDAVA